MSAAAALAETPRSPAVTVADFEGETATWIESEFATLDLGDARRNRRFRSMMRTFCTYPQASTPVACNGWAKTKAVYRFMSNEDIPAEAILKPHLESTAKRCKEHRVILCVQDTTSVNYSHHPGKTGLGPISTDPNARGLLVHSTMAFTPDRVPLGLLDLQRWVRDPKEFGKAKDRKEKDISEKESEKWRKSFRVTEELAQALPDCTLVSVSDREGDIYELFEEANTSRARLLLRASCNRGVDDDEHKHLWEVMKAQAVVGEIEVTVARRAGKKERTAVTEVRFAQVVLKAPLRAPGKKPIPLYAIYIHEPSPPPGEEPVSWMLLTTLVVKSFDNAETCAQYYAVRFMIEIFHRVLKSGCRIEARQYEEGADILERCLPTYGIVAWRTLYLTLIGRSHPRLPCTVVFEDDEWKSLCCYVHKKRKPPKEPPTLGEAMILVARLGGFLARKGDGHPGVKAIWEGLQQLKVITASWVAFGPGSSVAPGGP